MNVPSNFDTPAQKEAEDLIGRLNLVKPSPKREDQQHRHGADDAGAERSLVQTPKTSSPQAGPARKGGRA